jgi:hypothetical protein
MDQTSSKPNFAVPHAFFELFADRYLVAEMFFYVMLRKLMAQSETENGWVLLLDAPGSTAIKRNQTFAYYGLSSRTCKSARRKLKEDGLIECRWAHGRKGHRIGTGYRLVDERLAQNPKMIHQSIIGRVGTRVEGVSATQKEVLGEFAGIGGGVHNALD